MKIESLENRQLLAGADVEQQVTDNCPVCEPCVCPPCEIAAENGPGVVMNALSFVHNYTTAPVGKVVNKANDYINGMGWPEFLVGFTPTALGSTVAIIKSMGNKHSTWKGHAQDAVFGSALSGGIAIATTFAQQAFFGVEFKDAATASGAGAATGLSVGGLYMLPVTGKALYATTDFGKSVLVKITHSVSKGCKWMLAALGEEVVREAHEQQMFTHGKGSQENSGQEATSQPGHSNYDNSVPGGSEYGSGFAVISDPKN